MQKAKSIVHCWNGYGNKEKFLPERLSKQLEHFRCQVVGLKNPGIKLSKNMSYFRCKRSLEEFALQRKDGTFLIGGFDWLRSDFNSDKQDDTIVDREVAVALAGELARFYPS